LDCFFFHGGLSPTPFSNPESTKPCRLHCSRRFWKPVFLFLWACPSSPRSANRVDVDCCNELGPLLTFFLLLLFSIAWSHRLGPGRGARTSFLVMFSSLPQFGGGWAHSSPPLSAQRTRAPGSCFLFAFFCHRQSKVKAVISWRADLVRDTHFAPPSIGLAPSREVDPHFLSPSCTPL